MNYFHIKKFEDKNFPNKTDTTVLLEKILIWKKSVTFKLLTMTYFHSKRSFFSIWIGVFSFKLFL